MQLLEPVEQPQISRTRPLTPYWPLGRRRIGLDRKIEELSLRSPPERSRYAWIQKPNDRPKDIIRSKAIPSVNPKNPPVEAQHHSVIRMGEDSFHVSETECS
jgi:hypothetical protein